MRIVEIDGFMAVAEVDGVRREARLDLLPEVAVGDYVLVHAGLAIAAVDPGGCGGNPVFSEAARR